MTLYNQTDAVSPVLKVVHGTLSNGLRVIVLQLPHVHAVSLALMVRAGPRYETLDSNGISHLVEHLLFRGTDQHPSSYALNVAIEALGGEINGLTQRDATTIHMTVPPVAAEAGLAILGEIVTRPLLSGIDVERSVVIEEILDTTNGDGLETDIDAIARRVFWEDHPLSLPIAGSAENVERFTEAQCRAHFERTFVATNGVLCIAGPVDEPKLLAVAERAFGAMPRGVRLPDGLVPTTRDLPPIHVQETEDSQVALLMSFPAPHENHPDFPALLLLRRILDDGLASRMRQAVCEQRGLAYSLSASIDAYSDAGALDLDASCAPKKLVQTAGQMLTTLRTLVEDGVHADELVRVKTRHRAELEFGLDDPSEMCGWYGATELLGCRSTFVDRLSEAMAVTAEDLRRVAGEVFDPSRALLTLIGPAKKTTILELEKLFGRRRGSTVLLNTAEEAEADVEAA